MESNEFDGAFKKKEFRPPRRRRVVEDTAEEESSSPTPAPAAGSKKGWGENDDMDDQVGAAPAIRRGRPRAEEAEKEPGVRNQPQDDDDGDLPIIPALEDETDTVARQVASAPSLKTSRIQTIEELNRAIDTALPSAEQVGVDLGVLQAYLLPQEQLQEKADEVWDFDTEMRKLMSELQTERDELMADDALSVLARKAAAADAPPPKPVADVGTGREIGTRRAMAAKTETKS